MAAGGRATLRRVDAETDVVVVGAGAVGLACAAALSGAGREVVVVERHDGPARETTSRNSGVIHAGLYYPPRSLRAVTCVEGRERLYARCRREGIAHRRTGKLVVATRDEEIPVLQKLLARGLDNGAGALELLDAAEVLRREPRVHAAAGLFSPESGIVDAEGLARSYAAEAQSKGARLAFRTELTALEPAGSGWRVTTRGPDGELFALGATHVVNAAGLSADRVAAMAGLDVDALGWRLRFCKGDYFALAPRLGAVARHLVYPVPVHAGLGVHLTMDLGGAFRAGPDTEYVDAPRYDVDPDKADTFAQALRAYLPEVRASDLTPDYAGIRPKLYGPGDEARDFVLEARPAGLVHLIGIESPGLTASEALARRVAALLH